MSQTDIKRVVSMLAGEQKITLFTELGEVIDIKHGGPHDTTAIAEFLAPQLTGQTVIQINLRDYLILHNALGSSDVEYEEEGQIRVVVIDGKEVKGIFYPEKTKVTVQHQGKEVEIPKAENLMGHIKRANDENSPAVRNFLRRMAAVVDKRRHSAEDLMDFIEKSNLPLTNDGRIIGYKRVQKAAEAGYYVDCHSRSIKQRVGSRVWMDIDGVDPNRNKSCSHGLHVANKGYLGGFHRGNPTLVVVVDPEDFIAVPHGETTKCRVCAYDVAAVMTGSQSDTIDTGEHIEGDSSFDAIIAGIIEGRYQKPFEAVQAGQRKVLGVKKLTENDAVRPLVSEEQASVDTEEASGKALEETQNDDKKAAVNTTKKAKAEQKGKTIWDDAPANVITAFAALLGGTKSKAQIARELDTSPRTLQRWQDKFDYDGWVKARTAKEDPEPDTSAEEQKPGRVALIWKVGFPVISGYVLSFMQEILANDCGLTRREIQEMLENGEVFKPIEDEATIRKWMDSHQLSESEQDNFTIVPADTKLLDVYYSGKTWINLIKAMRMTYSLGLKEAKEAVEKGGLLFKAITEDQWDKLVTGLALANNEFFGDLEIRTHGSGPAKGMDEQETKEEAPKSKAKPAPSSPKKKGGVREQGQELYGVWQSVGGSHEAQTFQHLLDFKKAKKKGWSALGFNNVQIKKIERALKKLD